MANPVPNLGGAKVADLYYLYPELFQNDQNDQNIGNIDYTDDPQQDYITRLLEINNYLGLQNGAGIQPGNQPLQLRQRVGQQQQPQQIYDPYIITPEQLQMQLLQIEQAGK